MQRHSKFFFIALTVMLCCGWATSAVGVEMVKKIVVFHEDVRKNERMAYANDWALEGVRLVMDLPFMNGMVLLVPDYIGSAELADDPRVLSVEEDQKMKVQTVSATGDGGSGDGGSGDGGSGDGGSGDGGSLDPNPIITPVDGLEDHLRPWGVLNLYDHPYEAGLLGDFFDKNLASPIVLEALSYSAKIHVAVLDTGINYNHPDLKKYIIGGVDLVGFESGLPMDHNGHGTHVTGTIVSKYLGVTPERVGIYAVKVLEDDATGDVSTLMMALQWVLDNGVNVVNMSVAFAEDHPAVHKAVQMVHKAGVIMVAAAGNHSNWEEDGTISGDGGSGDGGSGDGGSGDGGSGDGGSSTGDSPVNPYPVMFPAAYAEVIAVGAMDAYEEMAAFSNSGPEVDVLAPGMDVVSTYMDGYGKSNGTSMATPHVTGAVVMMKAMARKNKQVFTPAIAKNILQDTAEDGVIDLAAALEAVKYGFTPDYDMIVKPVDPYPIVIDPPIYETM